MTNELHMKRYDNWCEVTHGHQMKEVPEGAGWGEYVRYEDAQAEITQLRGNLSLAEEGLANYALEVERLKQQVVDLRSDYLRRHKDAIDRFETLVKIRDHCEEIRGGAPPHVWIPSLINEVIGHEEHAHEPCELRLLFNKGIGVQRGNGFSFAFPTEEDANQAFHYICDLGTLQTSQPPKSETCEQHEEK